MNIIVDNPVLVCPRPVRLNGVPFSSLHASSGRNIWARIPSTAPDAADRSRTAEDSENEGLKLNNNADSSLYPEKSVDSLRASPRSTLSSEALEDFLSILKPSFFPPTTSPIMRARRHFGSSSVSSFPYERPFPYTTRIGLVSPAAEPTSLSITEDAQPAFPAQAQFSTPPTSPDVTTERDNINYDDLFSAQSKWFTSSALASPISRVHAGNPLNRHPSYNAAFAGILSPSSPSPTVGSLAAPISPALVPLPPATPEELLDMDA